MPEREHPPERRKHRLLAPTVPVAATPSRAHPLHESAHHRQQQIERPRPKHQAFHRREPTRATHPFCGNRPVPHTDVDPGRSDPAGGAVGLEVTVDGASRSRSLTGRPCRGDHEGVGDRRHPDASGDCSSTRRGGRGRCGRDPRVTRYVSRRECAGRRTARRRSEVPFPGGRRHRCNERCACTCPNLEQYRRSRREQSVASSWSTRVWLSQDSYRSTGQPRSATSSPNSRGDKRA